MAPTSGSLALVPPVDEPSALPLRVGSVRVTDGVAEIADAAGHIVLRSDGQTLELVAPSGDLKLSAPAGRVVVSSGSDVVLEAARDVEHRAAREVRIAAGDGEDPQIAVRGAEVELSAARLAARAEAGEIAVGHASVVAERIATTAAVLVTHAERIEVTATRIVERARDVFRDVADLLQTRAGRVRTLVDGSYGVVSERTTMQSRAETSIDGTKILLG